MNLTDMIRTKDDIDLFPQDWTVEHPKALVVLTHGIGEHSSRYVHVGEWFNRAGYSMHTYDLRGHGRSSGTRVHTPSIAHLMSDLALVVERAKQGAPGRKVFVYGHSMGGNITLNFALRHPKGLSGAIATSPWLTLPKPPPGILVVTAKTLSRVAPKTHFKRPRNVSALSHDPDVVKAAGDDPLGTHVITARHFVELSDSAAYALSHAHNLSVPLFLAHGTDDAYTNPQGSQQFFDAVRLEDKTLKLYPGMYHELHNEIEPTRSAHLRSMTDWLDAHL